MGNLTRSITTYAYFIDWAKVDENWNAFKHEMHLLDSLVLAQDPEKDLDALLKKYPEVARALPALIAVRMEDGPDLHVLLSYTDGILIHETFLFDGKPTDDVGRAKLVRFAKDSGILDIFRKRVAKSLPDFYRGVEVGIDTNGRKNRGGELMEKVVGAHLKRICHDNGWEWIPQATAERVKAKWGIKVQNVKVRWRPDFAVKTPKKLWLIEVNFYNRQGSKLKATAGEYAGKESKIVQQGFGYIWVTDGTGWQKSTAALRECFDAIAYTVNLEMCSKGCLQDLLAG